MTMPAAIGRITTLRRGRRVTSRRWRVAAGGPLLRLRGGFGCRAQRATPPRGRHTFFRMLYRTPWGVTAGLPYRRLDALVDAGGRRTLTASGAHVL